MKKIRFKREIFGEGFMYRIGQEIALDRVHPVVAKNAVKRGFAEVFETPVVQAKISQSKRLKLATRRKTKGAE